MNTRQAQGLQRGDRVQDVTCGREGTVIGGADQHIRVRFDRNRPDGTAWLGTEEARIDVRECDFLRKIEAGMPIRDGHFENPLPLSVEPTLSMSPRGAAAKCDVCGEAHQGTGCDPQTWQEGTAMLLRALGLSDAASTKSCSRILADDVLPAIGKLRGELEAAEKHVRILRNGIESGNVAFGPRHLIDRDTRQAYWNAQSAHDRFYAHYTAAAITVDQDDRQARAREVERLENKYHDATGQLLAVLHAKIGDQPPGPPAPPPRRFEEFA